MHNSNVAQVDWNVPKTEEGLQRILRRLDECRATGDLIEIGNGLLSLSFLVVWVRSDTAQPPFLRAHELAMEALDMFRRANDKEGQVRALVAALPMSDPETRARMLAEAESIAEELGDDDCAARVLSAGARGLAMSDRKRASELQLRALEMYRRSGNEPGQAKCLFSLAICAETPAGKRDFATEGARLFRSLGDPAEASRCVTLALMGAEKIEPIVDLEELTQEGLRDAQMAGDWRQEGYFYGKLALIATAKGQHEEAEKYRRWEADLNEADGLTPLERWKNDVEMTKTMIGTAKLQGNKDMVKAFQEELKRLKESKPKPEKHHAAS